MLARLLVVVVSCFLAAQLASSVLPGIKSTISQTGLNYARDVGLAYLQQKLNGMTVTVPNQSGEKDSIEWTISNIVVRDIKIPVGDAVIVSGSGLQFSTSSISASLTANWHGREKIWPHPSGSGTAQVTLSATSAITLIKFSVDNGHPKVDAQGTSVHVGKVDVKFSGSHLDFLLNLLKGLFEGVIKTAAENGIANAINTQVDTGLNNVLASFPVTYKLDSVSEIDYSLVANELFSSGYATISSKGEFYWQAHPTEAPYAAGPMPDDVASPAMAQIYVSAYAPNTACWVYWQAGMFNFTVTANMVPPESPITLNTSSWQTIVPPLYKAYPNWLMAARMYATAAPTLTFSPSGIKGLAEADIAVFVVSPKNQSLIPVFTVNITATLTGKAGINAGGNITAQIVSFSPAYKIVSSQIGNFDPTALFSVLNFGINIALPYLNTLLSQGMPLPSVDGLKLVSPTVSFADDYMSIITNFAYPPPAL